jgi:peptide/nickel transport system substrate-binding protein
MTTEKPSTPDRRGFLKTAVGTVAGLAVGGVVGYVAGTGAQAPTPGQATATVTVTETGSVTGPGPTGPGFWTKSNDETFVFCAIHPVVNTDPHQCLEVLDNETALQAYDPLVVMGEKGVKPHLCVAWDMSGDGLVYTFYARDDVMFHDGSKMTADDIAYSFQRALTVDMNPVTWFRDAMGSTMDERVGNVKVLTASTVQLSLVKTFGPFVSTLPLTYIVSKKTVETNIKRPGAKVNYKNSVNGDMGDWANEWLINNDAGSGPYRLKQRVWGDKDVYEAFPEYWGGWRPDSFRNLIYQSVPDPAQMKLMMQQGKAHMNDMWYPLDVQLLTAEDPSIKLYERQDYGPLYMNLNCQKPPLDDVNVRKAIAYAFNYDSMLNDILLGRESLQLGPFPNTLWGHDDTLDIPRYDVAKAKEYLAKAKYKPSEIKVTAAYVTGLTQEQRIALLLKANLAEIGIDCTPQEMTWNNIEGKTSQKDPRDSLDMVEIYFTNQYPDPDAWAIIFWSQLWKTGPSFISASYYENPKYDDLFVKARYEVDQGKRIEMYKEMQQILVQDQPALWLYNMQQRHAMRKDIYGYHFVPPAVQSYSKRYSVLSKYPL